MATPPVELLRKIFGRWKQRFVSGLFLNRESSMISKVRPMQFCHCDKMQLLLTRESQTMKMWWWLPSWSLQYNSATLTLPWTCTRPSEPRPRRSKFCPRRDIAASETLAENLKLPRLSRVSGASTSRRDVFRDVWWNTLTMNEIYKD